MRGNRLDQNDDSSESVMAVGMDLFATTFAVFFILAIISWSFQGGDFIDFEKITTITRIDGECGFNIVTSLDIISDIKKSDYCYSNGDCMDKTIAKSSVVIPTFTNRDEGTNLFIADFKIPKFTKQIKVESNNYLETNKSCLSDEDKLNMVEIIILYGGKEQLLSSTTLADFNINGISLSVQLEN